MRNWKCHFVHKSEMLSGFLRLKEIKVTADSAKRRKLKTGKFTVMHK